MSYRVYTWFLAGMCCIFLATANISSLFTMTWKQSEKLIAQNSKSPLSRDEIIERAPALLNIRGPTGETVLHRAAQRGEFGFVSCLLDYARTHAITLGADLINRRMTLSGNLHRGDWLGSGPHTLLELVAVSNLLVSTDYLLLSGAVPSPQLLGNVLRCGCISVGLRLIQYGVDVNAPDPYESNKTALHKAAEAGEVAAIKLLIEKGADQTLLDSSGKTPLALAKEHKQRNSIRLLSPDTQEASIITPPGKLESLKKSLVSLKLSLQNCADKLEQIKKPKKSFYSGISMFVGPWPEDWRYHERDVFVETFAIALCQKTAPIIVSAAIFDAFLKRKQSSEASLHPALKKIFEDFISQTIKNRNDFKKAEDVCIEGKNLVTDTESKREFAYWEEERYIFRRLPFNPNEWHIYKTPKGAFYLLIPLQDESKYEFYSSNKLQHIPDFSLATPINVPDYKDPCHDEEVALPITSFKNVTFVLYLCGHGGKQSSIAGMKVDTFSLFLDTLAAHRIISYLHYVSCFSGGTNVLTSAMKSALWGYDIKQYPFIISIQGVGETQVATAGLVLANNIRSDGYPITFSAGELEQTPLLRALRVKIDFAIFFEESIKMVTKQPNAQWKKIFESIRGDYEFEREIFFPSIRFPWTVTFLPFQFNQNTKMLTRTLVRSSEYTEGKIDIKKISPDDALVMVAVYPQLMRPWLTLYDPYQFIFMDPAVSFHFFNTIISPEPIAVINGLLENTTFAEKYFFIQNLEQFDDHKQPDNWLPTSCVVKGYWYHVKWPGNDTAWRHYNASEAFFIEQDGSGGIRYKAKIAWGKLREYNRWTYATEISQALYNKYMALLIESARYHEPIFFRESSILGTHPKKKEPLAFGTIDHNALISYIELKMTSPDALRTKALESEAQSLLDEDVWLRLPEKSSKLSNLKKSLQLLQKKLNHLKQHLLDLKNKRE